MYRGGTTAGVVMDYSHVYVVWVYAAVKCIVFRQLSLGYRNQTFLVLKLHGIVYYESRHHINNKVWSRVLCLRFYSRYSNLEMTCKILL